MHGTAHTTSCLSFSSLLLIKNAKWKNQSQKENTEWSHFHENSKIVKFIEVESRMVVARHGGTKFQLWKWVDSSDLTYINMTISSVQFSHSVVSNSLRPHEPQHARPPCPSPTPRVHTNPCPLSQWCHPTISSSVIPFSSCLQSPSIRVFSNESALGIRWSKYWSFSFNISPTNEHPALISFREDGLVVSPCSPTDSQESSPTRQFRSINSSALSFLYCPTLKSITWLLEKS